MFHYRPTERCFSLKLRELIISMHDLINSIFIRMKLCAILRKLHTFSFRAESQIERYGPFTMPYRLTWGLKWWVSSQFPVYCTYRFYKTSFSFELQQNKDKYVKTPLSSFSGKKRKNKLLEEFTLDSAEMEL
jgi:hypothetical protein